MVFDDGFPDQMHDHGVVRFHDRIADRHADVEVLRQLEEGIVLIEEREDEQGQSCRDRKSTRLNSSHMSESRMPSSA